MGEIPGGFADDQYEQLLTEGTEAIDLPVTYTECKP